VKIEVITPDTTFYTGEVRSVTVPGILGAFQVLTDHAPIISTLGTGPVKLVEMDRKEKVFNIDGGVIEVKRNRIIILAESAW
jgi:F-type H+-transporting ATPase subunit epsilon